MLTQFQIIERQAALLAACPRPRTLALGAVNTSGFKTSTSGITTTGTGLSTTFVTTLSAPSVSSAWSHSAPISFGSGVDERPATAKRPATVGYAGASLPVPMMAAVRPDSATLVAEGNGTARRNGGEPVATGINGSNNGTQQDKQHLTARRGPVTWRPPH